MMVFVASHCVSVTLADLATLLQEPNPLVSELSQLAQDTIQTLGEELVASFLYFRSALYHIHKVMETHTQTHAHALLLVYLGIGPVLFKYSPNSEASSESNVSTSHK